MIQMSESRLRRPGALCARQQDRPSTALPGDPRGSSHQAATPQVFRCQDRREPDWPEPRCRNAARPVVSPSSRPRLRRQVGPLCACRPTPLVPGAKERHTKDRECGVELAFIPAHLETSAVHPGYRSSCSAKCAVVTGAVSIAVTCSPFLAACRASDPVPAHRSRTRAPGSGSACPRTVRAKTRVTGSAHF